MFSTISRIRIREEATRWLSRSEVNVFVTVTLKRSLIDHYGSLRHMDGYEAERTGRIVRDRVLKAITRTGAADGLALPFYVFFETGSGNWHPHFHIVSSVPSGMTLEEYKAMFCAAVGRLHWVNEQIDFRAVTYLNDSDWQGVCHYSLKTGIDAFLPEASHVPSVC